MKFLIFNRRLGRNATHDNHTYNERVRGKTFNRRKGKMCQEALDPDAKNTAHPQ